jgi:hypothetical protein
MGKLFKEMKNIRFENTGKVFPSINYNGGMVWVDEKEGQKESERTVYNRITKQYTEVIAQTPDLHIEGVPVVEVDSLLDKEAEAYADAIDRRGTGVWRGMYRGYMAGYKAAQSKGRYTEEQMRQAYRVHFGPDKEDEYIQSIQPEIVVETEEELNEKNGAAFTVTVPITYEKNGRQYFKIKES